MREEIPCRVFKALVAEWKSGRLTQEQSGRMADHLSGCVGCAREARFETELREAWRTAPTLPSDASLWPQIARRLESASARHRPLFALPERRAFVGTASLAVLSVCGLWLWQKGVPPTPAGLSPTAQAIRPSVPAPLPIRYASWQALPDVSRVDPAVDDPAGASTENVWGVISAHGADTR